MTVASLKTISNLKGCGIFSEFTPAQDCPDFRKYNLIYGFNGSGKTTLTRIFSSIGEGRINSFLPEDASFELELDNGKTIGTSAELGHLSESILIFNVDFIWKNLSWRETSAAPVIYLSEAQKRDANRLSVFEKWLPTREKAENREKRDAENADSAFTNYKREVARIIAAAIGRGRNYDARHLDDDLKASSKLASVELGEEELSQLMAVVGRQVPKAKLQKLAKNRSDLLAMTDELDDLLSRTVAENSLEELQNHPSMQNWVKQGLDYHTAQEIEACLFCGNEVTSDRLELLKQVFDHQFDKFMSEISSLDEKLIAQRDRLANFHLPSDNDISDDLVTKYRAAKLSLESISQKRISPLFQELIDNLEIKRGRPSEKVQIRLSDDDRQHLSDWFDAIENINILINEHNDKHDNFESTIQNARSKIRGHFKATSHSDYEGHVNNVAEARRKSAAAKNRHQRVKNGIKALTQRVKSHGPAVAKINPLLAAYLGHSELTLESREIGYKILRHGREIVGPISEGEKTALALCYFFSKIEEEGKTIGDRIIVIDDPVSSLDTKAMNYAFNLIRSVVQDACQVFILTHNVAFMNEVKKWLKRRAYPQDAKKSPTASLYQVEAYSSDFGADRKANMRELDTLLRKYDSEYHYLFSLVCHLAELEQGKEFPNLYTMPNVLRKVLETFLAFKIPSSAGLRNKLENSVCKDAFPDEASAMAVDRLLQVESHGDNLETLITHCSITLEETRDAAKSIMALIKSMDERHFDSLSKQIQ